VGFDLLYTAIFHLGAKGIPLGLLSSALFTAWLTYHRDLCELRDVLDRSLAIFSSKVALGALVCAAVVGLMRLEMRVPTSGPGDFVYLCLLCGAGSVAFFATLLWTQALPKAWLGIFSKQANSPDRAPSAAL
jgi:hypothetical protein